MSFSTSSDEWLHYFRWSHPYVPFADWRFNRPAKGAEDTILLHMKGIRTKDNKSLHIRGEIYLVHVDPLLTTKTQANPIEALRVVTYSEIYKFLSDLNYAEFLKVRHKLCDLDNYPELVAYGLGCGFKVTRVVAVDYKKAKSTHVRVKGGYSRKGKNARKQAKHKDSSSESEGDDEDSEGYSYSDESSEDDWRHIDNQLE